ncbi:PREDICTED: sperm-associated antigen 6-like [Nicrophorus vespilloides]|uniref:Sperm-associated antigen 6-like n=1 Tax=Nicrophorus vespilloides TaxID=110193 RepID=A0ABM1MIW1_NICVS|nr:PREDICTED: sperm-associated antigen 6-like [Nicrophorus vespilloides]
MPQMRTILQVFTNYQKARISFVQTVADLATKQQNVDVLNQARVLDLIKPLLSDVCPQIRQCAAIALGRLVDADPDLARSTLNTDLLPSLLADLDGQNKYFKKSILFVIRSICKHDHMLAQTIIENGGLNAVIYCMGDFEPMVKESALWAVGYIARHDVELARAVADAGAIPNIVLCLQEPEIAMKQVAANVISDIAKHSEQLAQQVVDCGAVPFITKALNNEDEKLKRIVLNTLSNIAKHSTTLAEDVVEANAFPNVLIHLAHACPRVRKQAACLVRDVVRHSLPLTQMVVNLGGIGALIETISNDISDETRMPCFVALGYIAGHNDQIALSVLSCNGVNLVADVLQGTDDDALLAVSAWTLGQMGKHSPEHSKQVAAANVFPRLLELYCSDVSSEDLKDKAKTCLKQCLQKCMYMPALEPLVYDAPPDILKYVLGQFAKVLPSDPKARRMFVTTGALKKLQEIEVEPGTTLMEYVTIINACFPEEIVRYYSPGYSETLLEQVEQYTPEMMNILRDAKYTASEVQTDNGIVVDEIITTTPTPSKDLKSLMQ